MGLMQGLWIQLKGNRDGLEQLSSREFWGTLKPYQ